MNSLRKKRKRLQQKPVVSSADEASEVDSEPENDQSVEVSDSEGNIVFGEEENEGEGDGLTDDDEAPSLRIVSTVTFPADDDGDSDDDEVFSSASRSTFPAAIPESNVSTVTFPADDDGDSDDEVFSSASRSTFPAAIPESNASGRMDPARTAIARQRNSMCGGNQTNHNGVWLNKPGTTVGFVNLTHRDKAYKDVLNIKVPKNRVNKAMEKLNPVAITKVQNSNASCYCVNDSCQLKVSFMDILRCRKKLFANPDLATEQRVTEEAVKILKAENPQPSPDKVLYYFVDVGNTKLRVCSRFWAAMYGVCETKMKKVRTMVKHNSTTTLHGAKHQEHLLKKSSQTMYCHAFWTNFFGLHCQRPTDEFRLFPVNKPFHVIYDEYFLPWYTKAIQRDKGENGEMIVPDLEDERNWAPSLSTFKRARWHTDFADVKKRARHYHCKCTKCDTLNTIRLRGFVDDIHKKSYEIAFKAHEAEARGWHEHEELCKLTSRRNPAGSMVLGYDDTSDLGFPKMTNREPKNFTKTRLNFVPFNITNYTSGTYVCSKPAYTYSLSTTTHDWYIRHCKCIYAQHTIIPMHI
jgi:hypothetical protein